MVVLVGLPLLPRLGEFLKAVSPYVQSFRLGAVRLDLRAAGGAPIAIPASGFLASVPTDVSALSSGTAISVVVSSCGNSAGRVAARWAPRSRSGRARGRPRRAGPELTDREAP
jgi:hypothetical protein